ncbi:hypothetical protein EYR38_006465 [Pleurotus pulmonarius]|nr:hypothetical protein EYR38_006465 [Pleurotus pulmonarius]
MRIYTLIPTIALLNWGSVASALTHRALQPYTEPAATFADDNVPGLPRTGASAPDPHRRDLRHVRDDYSEGKAGSTSERHSVPDSSGGLPALEGGRIGLAMPPAQPPRPNESSTTTAASNSADSLANSALTPLNIVKGTEKKLLAGDKSSSSPESSSSTTASPSSSETPSKNEANDNISKYTEEVRVENDRFLDLVAKKAKGDPKQGR